jgi:hypothetical protein
VLDAASDAPLVNFDAAGRAHLHEVAAREPSAHAAGLVPTPAPATP